MTTKKINTYKNPHLSKAERRRILRGDAYADKGRPKKHYPSEVNKKERWYSPEDILKDLESLEEE